MQKQLEQKSFNVPVKRILRNVVANELRDELGSM